MKAQEWVALLAGLATVLTFAVYLARRVGRAIGKLVRLSDAALGRPAENGEPAQPGIIESVRHLRAAQEDLKRGQQAIQDQITAGRLAGLAREIQALASAVTDVATTQDRMERWQTEHEDNFHGGANSGVTRRPPPPLPPHQQRSGKRHGARDA